jgi:hypothetical protein
VYLFSKHGFPIIYLKWRYFFFFTFANFALSAFVEILLKADGQNGENGDIGETFRLSSNS